MATKPSKSNPKRGTRRKKKPAYPKVGAGEDKPALRPGTKTGETASGQKQMQSTRGTIAARNQRYQESKLARTRTKPLPNAKPYDQTKGPYVVTLPTWPYTNYGGRTDRATYRGSQKYNRGRHV